MSIIVKLIRIPGTVAEVGLNDGATVQDAIDASDLTVGDAETVKVGTSEVSRDYTLSDGDRIILAEEAKGNA